MLINTCTGDRYNSIIESKMFATHILYSFSLHVDNGTFVRPTSTQCDGGGPGAREARSMLLGERALTARSRRRWLPTDEY